MKDYLRELEVEKLNITGREGLPFWTIIHFFERTIAHHMKVTTIQRICELTAQGAPDNYFYIAKNSVDVYQDERVEFNQFKDFKILESKDRHPEAFWDLIVNLKRPIVFFDDGIERIPLYDFTYNEALRITSFKENSPFNANLEGAGGSLVDLFYAREREERLRNEHLNNYLGQATENIERIVRTSQVIEDPNTPAGVQYYARMNLMKIMRAQDRLNEKVGINDIHIDERV
ncbi:hypothetical protein M3629_00345 [Paenibacillus polysaccharolyticus]|uniref:hypothetical protein n=1 Tax=Paenibacillus polysaccharolyticus TaxID=582692 RepID=UPI00203D7586|nr:hypothetical protein [Paenibacillus polysaccharolyticus]MCM3131212.1 hypothetical protein [Paenibacillus polysaccharolyticus]